jgi:hypothetical protein
MRALLDRGHVDHRAATAWFAQNATNGWASCPITQNGCLRSIASQRYRNSQPIAAVGERLREATATRYHEFWPDDVSIVERSAIDVTRIHGPKQLTDVYLLALAVRRGGRFVTFDTRIAFDAVVGAQPANLLVI